MGGGWDKERQRTMWGWVYYSNPAVCCRWWRVAIATVKIAPQCSQRKIQNISWRNAVTIMTMSMRENAVNQEKHAGMCCFSTVTLHCNEPVSSLKRFVWCVSFLHVEQKNQHATITETEQSMLESQLQTEREALERKEKEVGYCSTQICVPNFNETDRHTFKNHMNISENVRLSVVF